MVGNTEEPAISDLVILQSFSFRRLSHSKLHRTKHKQRANHTSPIPNRGDEHGNHPCKGGSIRPKLTITNGLLTLKWRGPRYEGIFPLPKKRCVFALDLGWAFSVRTLLNSCCLLP